MSKLTIVVPEAASGELVALTEFLTKTVYKGEWQGGGLLGGEFGYGVDFENDTFMMHPFCWCERESECLWCMMNDPAENPNYDKMKSEIQARFGKECAEWGGAPNFYYKPSKTWMRWYKWIGRDQEQGGGELPADWLKKCEASVNDMELKDEEVK